MKLLFYFSNNLSTMARYSTPRLMAYGFTRTARNRSRSFAPAYTSRTP